MNSLLPLSAYNGWGAYWFVLALLSSGLVAMPQAALADFKALAALERQGARVSAYAVDLQDGKPIQVLHPEQRLSPASTTKLVVAAAALDTWAADKTFKTQVFAVGQLRDRHLDGDLVLTGEGDPTFTHGDLWQLAGMVRSQGLLSVSGKLVVRPPFGPLGCDNADRCDALERSDTAYNVPMASLSVDYGTWCAEVRPTQVGKPAELRSCGGIPLPIAVEGSVTTLAAQAKSNYWVERRTRDGQDYLQVGGAIAQRGPEEVYRAMSVPAYGTGLLLKRMLQELGVQVGGGVEVRYGLPPKGTELASVEGLGLREQLARMLRHSNNYIADLLTLGIASVRGAKPETQLAEASSVLADFVARSSGRSGGAPRIYSGSGLTPENEISAKELVDMLASEYHDTRNFSPFYGGLVVPRQAPYAFLRGGNRAWLDRVALKTGTMSDPRSVSAMAGYLRRKNGGWMAFAILINGSDRVRRVPLYKSVKAIRSDIEDILERY